ncbi:MAG TPA: hypothetical protein VEY93_04710, partial [Longimicrobium sp.]|nr:hypothetical protein [Longimicrobium sp.]
LTTDDGFHARLRDRSAGALGRYRDAALSVSPRRGGRGGGMGPSLALNLRSPAVGDQVTVNTSLEPCKNPKNVTARVAAISERSIVLADVANPANGLTDADYRSFALGFDTLVYPAVTNAFGTPEDLDGNGKAVILYTKAVNELTERGSTSYVGGYFHPRDLFPTRDRDGLAACATTNYAEMFYMLVPDPAGSLGTVFSRELILQTSLGTIGHEFQHLINASRRLYVVETTSWNEATWLNEGLSHIAEEVLFHRASGMTPRRNLSLAEVQASPRSLNAFRSYMDQNIRRYARYLQEPSTESPYDSTEAGANDLPTRGASWAFLRYAADRRAGDDVVLWRDLVDTDVIGFANLQQALGRDPREWIRDWATSAYTDDVVATEARFQQPSWRYRTFFNTFPLVTQPLTDGYSTQLASGGAAFLRFTVAPATVGTVRALSGTNPLPSRVYVTVVRTR